MLSVRAEAVAELLIKTANGSQLWLSMETQASHVVTLKKSSFSSTARSPVTVIVTSSKKKSNFACLGGACV